MPAAVIFENKILAVLTADPSVDVLTDAHGYPRGSYLIAVPAGCNETWEYNGTEVLAPVIAISVSSNKVEF
jgi:hypothetical protein